MKLFIFILLCLNQSEESSECGKREKESRALVSEISGISCVALIDFRSANEDYLSFFHEMSSKWYLFFD